MDGRLIVVLTVLVILIIVIVLGLREKKNSEKALREYIKKHYGMTRNQTVSLPALFKHHTDNANGLFCIDDITENDLDIDKIYSSVNHTFSPIGREYLYYKIKYQSFNSDEYNHFEQTVNYLSSDYDIYNSYAMPFAGLKSSSGYNPDEYLGSTINNKKLILSVILLLMLYLISAALIFIYPGAGIILLLATVCYAIIRYFSYNSGEGVWVKSAFYIVALVKACEGMLIQVKHNSDKSEYLASTEDKCRRICTSLKSAMRGTGYVSLSIATNKNIFSLIIDYINMLFHIDILLFAVIDVKIKKKKEDIFALNDAMGYIETALSVCSYRKSLDTYCIPEFDEPGDELIRGLYHPLMKNAVKNDFEPSKCSIITGSNASGKSTYLKAAALCFIMAQSIHTVCADSYHASFKRIYTSMALKDNILNGDSFFMAEIKSLKRISDAMNKSSVPVLAFVDEILKGTNTTERIASSCRLALYLHDKGAGLHFATHDIEIGILLKDIFRNIHFTEDINDKDVVFTYKLAEGCADTRNAIKLLERIGFDNDIVDKAEKMALFYDANKEWKLI